MRAAVTVATPSITPDASPAVNSSNNNSAGRHGEKFTVDIKQRHHDAINAARRRPTELQIIALR